MSLSKCVDVPPAIAKLISKVDKKLQRINIIGMEIIGFTMEEINNLTFDDNPVFPQMYAVLKRKFMAKFKVEYKPDLDFDKKHQLVGGQEINYKEVLNNCRHTMILGSAGAGKTTLVRYYSKHGKKFWPTIKVVIYLEFRNVHTNDKVHLEDVILGAEVCPELDIGEDRKKLFHWMIDNQGSVLFAMDGYDQLQNPFLNQKKVSMTYKSLGTKGDFFRNIINGNLFGDSKVITSSREHAVQDLPLDCMPQVFTQLGGFCKENIDKVVVQLSDQSVLDQLKTKNVVLYTLCAQPLYTHLVVAIYKVNPDNTPDTLTGVLTYLICNFMRSENMKGNTCQSFGKLMKLAFNGTKNKKVVFHDEDLSKFNLLKSDIEDFMNLLPAGFNTTIVINNILEGGYCVNFVHQNLQEYMAALHAVSLEPSKFKEFVSNNVVDRENQWTIVHRLILGIVCKDQVQYDLKDLNIFMKNIILTKNQKIKKESAESDQTAQAALTTQNEQVVHHHEHHYHDNRTHINETHLKYVDKRKQAINIAYSPNANIDLSGAFNVGAIDVPSSLGPSFHQTIDQDFSSHDVQYHQAIVELCDSSAATKGILPTGDSFKDQLPGSHEKMESDEVNQRLNKQLLSATEIGVETILTDRNVHSDNIDKVGDWKQDYSSTCNSSAKGSGINNIVKDLKRGLFEMQTMF